MVDDDNGNAAPPAKSPAPLETVQAPPTHTTPQASSFPVNHRTPDSLRRAIPAAGVALWSWNVAEGGFAMDAQGFVMGALEKADQAPRPPYSNTRCASAVIGRVLIPAMIALRCFRSQTSRSMATFV